MSTATVPWRPPGIDATHQLSPQEESSHKLARSFTFSYFHAPRNFDGEDYSGHVQQLAVVNTVEEFWRAYCHIRRPGDINTKLDLHFFKADIRPVWEDPENVEGGKLFWRIKANFADRIWENMLLLLAGYQFEDSEDIAGVVCTMRGRERILSIWHRSKKTQEEVERFAEVVSAQLEMPSSVVWLHKSHVESFKKRRSYH